MKEKEVELVVDFCPGDCVYMSHIDDGTPMCYYAVIAKECRRCKISECDKYRSGKPIRPRLNTVFTVFWEREFYDEDDNSLW